MNSSMAATAPASPAVAPPATTAAMSSGSAVSSIVGPPTTSSSLSTSNPAQFREIHKNTWLKRLTSEGKKITVGPKKSERSWVVFCVHDDTEALLEGYAEPRQAASHTPEWIVTMQDTLHISHALIPNSHEFEFVVTLSNEVLRFHAMSWDIMQEWVETLRSKLREMKILSPRENLYTKLPEIRAPLLPTRDPTSPLPAPPPVPAALVPGVERVVTASVGAAVLVTSQQEPAATSTTNEIAGSRTSPAPTTTTTTNESYNINGSGNNISATVPLLTSMSNTLTQNLLNMLSDPISAYSEQLNVEANAAAAAVAEGANVSSQSLLDAAENLDSSSEIDFSDFNDDFHLDLLRKSSGIEARPAPAIVFDNSVRVDVGVGGCSSNSNGSGHRVSADQIKNLENILQCERLIPRPQTSRSLSAGAADKSRKHVSKFTPTHQQHNEFSVTSSTANQTNKITELILQNNTTTEVVTTSSTSVAATTTKTTAADPKTNITIIQVSTNSSTQNNTENEVDPSPPKLPIKPTTADIFKFPDSNATTITTTGTPKSKHHEYKSNVQIIPSNVNSSTIQVLGQNTIAVANQYSMPAKKQSAATVNTSSSSSAAIVTANAAQIHIQNQNQITTVHVAGLPIAICSASETTTTTAASVSVYGTCYSTPFPDTSTPKLPKKIILSANTSGITNITVNNATAANTTSSHVIESLSSLISNDSGGGLVAGGDSAASVKHNVGNVHYEKVFLSSSIPISKNAVITSSTNSFIAESPTPAVPMPTPISPNWRHSPRRQAAVSSSSTQTSDTDIEKSANTASSNRTNFTPSVANVTASAAAHFVSSGGGSPAMQRMRIASPTSKTPTNQPPLPSRPAFLARRGLTEAVITRPSRKDYHNLKLTKLNIERGAFGVNSKNISAAEAAAIAATTTTTSNNNGETSTAYTPPPPPLHATVNRTNSESLEQRRRSSSTSDAVATVAAQRNQRGANNNEFSCGRGSSGVVANALLRIQQPPQPFRVVENGIISGGCGDGLTSTTTTTTSPASKRMTLREQQVMQLRREIMHPGGVRLQLRRKDCVGSIAWVDAFGAVWVAGWKQKEHPMLYNALHIGDQLLSIAGMTITSAAEANKIIRNTNTLFVEVLVRRIPFGRGYAIRRERDGQCLGLIRDGNTSTIVDVVPNSLAARHGLPPKAQSCDGTTLTFWVLTEINGRPLNLFFKEHEIRDRLNSVGRDISIFVQPSDLIAKLKKQLKSLRGHKDYLVQ